MPITMMNAKSETMFREMSSRGSTAMAPSIEIGRPRLTQKARRRRMKSARTEITSRRPREPFERRVSSRPRKYTESSCQVVSEIPSGSVSEAFSTKRCTARAMSGELWSPTRKTWSSTAGSPSNRDQRSSSSKPATTCATSPIVTRVPSARTSSGRRSNSSPR
jgi:hypothetical protein